MTRVFLIKKKIVRWTLILQQKYTKLFKNYMKDYKFTKNMYENDFIVQFFQIDKRILIGSLKYIPYMIFCVLKTIPMPWEKTKLVYSIKHISGSLIISNDQSFTFDLLFLSQWSTLWMMTKKYMIYKNDFLKIRFPLFDDEEKIRNPEHFFTNTLSSVSIKDKYPFIIYIIKNWFYEFKKIFLYFLKKQYKNFFFIDNFTHLVLSNLTMRSNLYIINFRNNISIFSIIKLWCIFFYNFKFKSITRTFQLNNSLIPEYNFYLFHKYEYPFLYNLPFNYLGFIQKFFVNQLHLDQNFEHIILKKNSSFLDQFIIIKNLNKKYKLVYNKNSFYPFFEDLFFTKKGVSLIFNLLKINFSCIIEKQYLKPSYKIELINKLSIIPEWNLNDSKLTSSHFFLLKNYTNKNKNKKKCKKSFSLFNIFSKNIFFSKNIINWIQMGIYVCTQSHNIMTLLLGRKNLKFLYLDFNFNLKPTRVLTTKERKKSRFSNSFHLCREILRFIKIIIDVHVQHTESIIDEYQLIDGISYIFTHVGQLTAIYRYKYKTIYQIRICKSIKEILYLKLNKNQKSIGFGFWAPFWRIWLFFLRGIFPLLQRWLSNLVSRHFFGRMKSKKTLKLTKQRIDTYYEIELKKLLIEELKNKIKLVGNEQSYGNIIRMIKKAWKCWKANIPWFKKNIGLLTQKLVVKYLKAKSEWFTMKTFIDREQIKRGVKVDRILIKKNTEKMTRLWFRAEQIRQLNYIEKGPFIQFSEISGAFNMLAAWLIVIKFSYIIFPSFSEKSDIKLLILGIDNIRESIFYTGFNSTKIKNECKKLEIVLNNPYVALKSIKEKIITDKNFSEIGVSFLDNFYSLIPIYFLEMEEKLTDNFIDQYLWLEGAKKMFFPSWIKPSDSELNPFSIYKLSSHFFDLQNKNTECSEKKYSLVSANYVQVWENIDFSFLKKILVSIIDDKLIEYMITKNNAKLFYKDMIFTNFIGIIRGLPFSGFLYQFYLLITDLFILGIDNAKYIYLQRTFKKNIISNFKKNSIILYFRYFSKVMLFLESLDDNFSNILETRVPIGLSRLSFCNNASSKKIYNSGSPNIFIAFCGFKIFSKNIISKKDKKLWFLSKNLKNKHFKYVLPLISTDIIKQLENRLKQFLFLCNSTTFMKISNKWNLNAIGFVFYFRESCINSNRFIKIASNLEKRIQIKIKTDLNSKMPSRFPPVLFYSPRELGGLGMISLANPFVPETDLRYSINNFTKNTSASTDFLKIEIIPSLTNYVLGWEFEFLDSYKIWTEFLVRKFQSTLNNQNLSIDILKDLWNKGIPRINTLFQKNKHTLAYDHGWRIRLEMKKYNSVKFEPFWWTNEKHDGKLWDLNKYRIDLIQILGGIENILEHTLFKSTYFSSWEGLFWEKVSGFENFYKSKLISNAQRNGLNQLPNRRFILWWSPTINRGNVFIGFRTQLDLTGIFMYGKIPTLKISLIQIFRSHLWQKIHESITIDISKYLDKHMTFLEIQTVQKELIHPKKSCKNHSSCADIVLYSVSKWKIEFPSLLLKNFNYIKKESTFYSDKFWFDIQLRWGDFDSHDIERYSRSKFLEFTSDLQSVYPCITGAIISIDLAYNIFSAYGYWFKNLKFLIYKTVLKILKINPSLYILRERIRKSLQLFRSEPNEPIIGLENFINSIDKNGTWLLDDSSFYRVSIRQSKEGNVMMKPVNGILFVFLPENGKIFLRIIHKSYWQGQKRLSQLAKWKAAEEVVKLIKNISLDQQPSEIIVFKKNSINSLIIHLIDFPDIVIKGSLIKIPFQSLIKLKKIKKLIDYSFSNNLFIFNLYDNWLESISSFTAFSRLLLILKAIKINYKEVKIIFNQFKIPFKENNDRLWPEITDKQWVKLEIALKDIIVDNYCYRKKINPKSLSQQDVRLIILGFTSNLDHKFNYIYDINFNLSDSIRISHTTDKFGKNLLVSIYSKEEPVNFISIRNWQYRSIFEEKQNLLLKNLKIEYCFSTLEKVIFVIPKNLIKYFFLISSPLCQVISLMFGFFKNKKIKIYEIRLLLIPPQIFNHNCLIFKAGLIQHNLLKNLSFFGFMISISSVELLFNNIKKLIPNLCKICATNGITSKFNLIVISSNFFNCKLVGFQIRDFSIIKKNFKKKKLQIFITDRFFGLFLVPESKKWNYFFKPLCFENLIENKYILDLPYSFFNYIHYT
nr:splicing factor Prp8 [Cryptomonas curvata]